MSGYGQVRWTDIGYVAGYGRFRRMRFLPVDTPATPYLDARACPGDARSPMRFISNALMSHVAITIPFACHDVSATYSNAARILRRAGLTDCGATHEPYFGQILVFKWPPIY